MTKERNPDELRGGAQRPVIVRWTKLIADYSKRHFRSLMSVLVSPP